MLHRQTEESVNKFKQRKKRLGFTLAEVLITLGIIGVVAALTIPNLVSHFQEQAYISQFKKAYTELFQAYLQSAQENGTADQWATTTDALNNIRPYLKIIKDCTGNVAYPWCDMPNKYKDLYGTDGNTARYNFALANGSSIFLPEPPTATGLVVQVDINGFAGPGQYGYDVFKLTLGNKNDSPIVAYPYYPSAWLSSTSAFCRKSATSASIGWTSGGGCACWLLKHWNMDYLHRDIPDSEWAN